MSDTPKPIRFECIAWQKNYYAGKFVEWIRVGKGYIEIKDGKPRSYIRYQSTVRGDSVNTVLLPVGETPPPPTLAAPKRPDDSGEPEEDFSE